jgi:hypothetical protein
MQELWPGPNEGQTASREPTETSPLLNREDAEGLFSSSSPNINTVNNVSPYHGQSLLENPATPEGLPQYVSRTVALRIIVVLLIGKCL